MSIENKKMELCGSSVGDGEVLHMISRISDLEPNHNPFEATETDIRRVNSLQMDISTAKSSFMTEASPEPILADEQRGTPLERHKAEDDKDLVHFALLQKTKKIRLLLISIIIALTLAFTGTLIGIIILMTSHSGNKAVEGDLAEVKYPSSVGTSIPYSPLTFHHVDTTDPDIAKAFADHSLFLSFYGVTYEGPNSIYRKNLSTRALSPHNSSDTHDAEIQHAVTLDVALLSRITGRIRLVYSKNHLADRVIQAIRSLNFNMKVTFSIQAEDWEDNGYDFLRVLRSYPFGYFDCVHIEHQPTTRYEEVYKVYADVMSFMSKYEFEQIEVKIVDNQINQPNPLELSANPKMAIEWINSDETRLVYSNLETPSETSEKAGYMTSWVCGVVPHLSSDIQWYWSNAFDNTMANVTNGIFTETRELKPAGLPRCMDY